MKLKRKLGPWHVLGLVWNFLGQLGQNKKSIVTGISLVAILLQQGYLYYFSSDVTIPYSEVSIDRTTELFENGFKIILQHSETSTHFMEKYGYGFQKFISFNNIVLLSAI
jgi:hypothetical protein